MTKGIPKAAVPPARLAGFLYLIVAVAGSFALFAGPGIVSGNAAATAANILAGEEMWRLNFVALLIAGAAYVSVVAILYELFKPVSATLSIVAALFGLMSCATSIMHAFQLAPLFYLGDAAYLAAFDAEQLQALAYVSLRLQAAGENIGFLYSGLYTLSLGFLVLGSAFLPRFLGVLLAITGLSWLARTVASFLALPLAEVLSNVLMAAAVFGELAFLLWILVMGVDAKGWRDQAGAVLGESGSR